MHFTTIRLTSAVAFATAWGLFDANFVFAAPPPKLDFNRDIQPILSDNCYSCHGPDKETRKGGLRLDMEADAKRAVDGVTAIVPGNAAASEAIKRILSTDPEEVMPTPKSKRKLTTQQRDILKRWVEEGAAWGKHWAFEAPKKLAVPQAAGSVQALDAFVRAKLAAEGLSASPEAPKETLIRRVTLDLTGLPPTPEEVDAFLRDTTPEAYARVVDRLLKSPRYGERWCWDWLDGARYADTNGYQGDPERTMWPWRDWVIKAINDNMPFDQFTVWQLAGDQLPQATQEQKLATGFHRNHMINGEGGRIAEETRVENVMDRVETTGTMWLGLTVGCCRCHDHKFDPLSLRDYYSLYDFFNQTSETGVGRAGQTPPVLDISTDAQRAQAEALQKDVENAAVEVTKLEETVFPRSKGQALSDSPAAKDLSGNILAEIKRAPRERGPDGLREMINLYKEKQPAYTKALAKLKKAVEDRKAALARVPRVMIMDTLEKPRDTFILVKGAYDKPTTEKVTANVPASLPPLRQQAGKGNNRLALAQWLVARENPLTARVTVNRFWQAFFGVGLVKTVEDFGVQGEKPANQELLDWLAVQFMDSGWDVKALHRLIVMSATYRQSSKVTPQLYERDPQNRLLARGPRFRLPSWMMRDQSLFVAGLLKENVGGPPVKPYQPEGIWEEATFGKISYKQDHGDALYRRSLYTFWRRIVGPTMFFDNAARQTCSVGALRTNTPLHALTTLNDVTYVEAARAMAQRVMLAANDDAVRLNLAFRLATSRPVKPQEQTLLLRRLEDLKTQFRADPAAVGKLLAVGESKRDDRLDAIGHAAWTALCQLVLNLDETITKE